MTSSLNNLWNDDLARDMSEPELLRYRSNLLGADLRITNFGGGNTSAKVIEKDPLTGEATDVLWVKGSGGDLGSIDAGGFATLYLDKLKALRRLYRGLQHEDEMVGYLPHCTFGLNTRAASIDTPLHTYIRHKHVDHMHPDAVIAIACTERSEELTREVFGGRLGWLPWQRPGYDLGLKLGEIADAHPELEGVVLAGHGLFTWADTSKDCYLRTLDVISRAAAWLEQNESGRPFGGPRFAEPLADDTRNWVAAKIMPSLRGKITGDQRKVGHFDDRPEVLEFVGANDLQALATLGTSCPDHFLRTKIRPLVLDFAPDASDLAAETDRLLGVLDHQLSEYRQDYAAYYDRCKRPGSPAMRDPNAVVYLIPGVGMMTFAKDKATARVASEFYVNAINVIRGASSVDRYIGLAEQEAFDIEYWALEEAKLQRMPKPKRLAGQVAVVTGGAGGIGSSTAARLADDGACVVIADIDESGMAAQAESLKEVYGKDRIRMVTCDVTDETMVEAALSYAVREFGGVDILVSNAGIASSSPLDETSLSLWQKNIDVLTTGYFLVSREAFKIMKEQGIGGSIVFVASKNALVASANAAAYCTAKGAELQLARSIALEGAPLGVRCNVVNPDAVLEGSKIWTGTWRKERAAAYDLDSSGLEEHYKNRSLLKRSVLPSDVAEACHFFASDLSAKSTGNILNVDAGHAPSFTR
ncbi:MAG: bifunctional rhamnulose-1-phosphate aldolase/short-chain dehydrogenase [Pseudomonadota bacterium]